MPCSNNLLITENEVIAGKSHNEAFPYWLSDSEVNTLGATIFRQKKIDGLLITFCFVFASP